jgi:Uma2 family endonuclease
LARDDTGPLGTVRDRLREDENERAEPKRPHEAASPLPKRDENDEEVETVVQPDVLVVCEPSKLDRRGVRGAPDLVIEVLSAATASHDQVLKRRVYERAGVREYWLVHSVDRVVTVYRLVDGEYGRPDVFELAGTTPVGVLPGVAIAWDELVQRLPKPDG